jgi:protein TonB
MNEAATFQARKHPAALTIVILLHGAALTALALNKMEVIGPDKIPRTIVDLIEQKDPPPPEQKQTEAQKPRVQQTVIERTIPIIKFPPKPTEFEWKPLPPPTGEVIPKPGPVTQPKIEIPPPPKPEPRKVEPARAKANLGSYVSDADYPGTAVRAEEQGTTRFRLGVGADGRVTQCTVTQSSGSSSLDATTCRLMKSRARFTPARDGSGQPTGDSVSSAIKWVLPDG